MPKKKPLLKLLCVTTAFTLLSSCAKHYYNAHLYDGSSGSYELAQEGTVYVEGAPGIVTVDLKSVYVGNIQRNFDLSTNSLGYENKRGVYKDKEVWIVCKAESIDNQSPLAPSEVNSVGFTSVKIDQSSNTTIPISGRESQILKLTADRDYLVTMKIYEVDAYKLKKILYENRNTDLLKWAYTTVDSAIKTTGNIIAGTLLDKFRTLDQSAIEEYLLAAGSDLEFKGTFYLLNAKPDDLIKDGGDYALVDIIRSKIDHNGDQSISDGNMINPNESEYIDNLVKLRGEFATSINFDDLTNYTVAAPEQYIKFQVSSKKIVK